MTFMRAKPVLSCVCITAAAFGLQGCVAAAFPLAAGGLLGERSLSGNSSSTSTADPMVEVAQSPESQSPASDQLVNSDLAPVESEPTSASPPATSARADFNAAFAGTATATTEPAPPPATVRPPQPVQQLSARQPSVLPQGRQEPQQRPQQGPAPAPSPAAVTLAPPANAVRPRPTPVPSAREPFGPSGVTQLLSYANSRQIASEEEPVSAMLSDRVALEPVKAQCGGVSPTILIDLDPKGALFDSTSASRPPSGLARGLAQLRENGVGVAWISGNGIEKLDGIKRALTYSGLDLRNEDRILLVRSPDDRKQTLREELSQISCLIAIAGDTRSDFDELYDYLKNPSDAQSLEPLIGDGWFIIPQPLL